MMVGERSSSVASTKQNKNNTHAIIAITYLPTYLLAKEGRKEGRKELRTRSVYSDDARVFSSVFFININVYS